MTMIPSPKATGPKLPIIRVTSPDNGQACPDQLSLSGSGNSLTVTPELFQKFVRDMPKTELHTHVEGAVRPETILDLAGQYNVALPAKTLVELKTKIGMGPKENLLDFLKKFDCFRFVFDRPETLKRLAYEMVQENARENVGYTEIRINPVKHEDVISVDQVLDSVLAGIDAAKKDLGVDARLIVSINRSYPVESAMKVAEAAVRRMDRGVVGLDLAGDEVHNPASKFAPVFDYARDHGLHITLHAGEAVGPDSIRQAMDDCHAERIGHGVRLQEDPALEQRVKEQGTVLEMCPTSNVLLNVVDAVAHFPLKHYLHEGIAVTLNTDDRHIFDINLSGEYMALAQNTGLSLQELEQVSLNGVKAAFLPADEKQALLAKFERKMEIFHEQVAAQLAFE